MAGVGGSTWAPTRLEGGEEKDTSSWDRSSQPLTQPGAAMNLILQYGLGGS